MANDKFVREVFYRWRRPLNPYTAEHVLHQASMKLSKLPPELYMDYEAQMSGTENLKVHLEA